MRNSDILKPDQAFLLSAFSANGYQTCSIGKQHHNSGRKLFEKQVQRMLPEALHYFDNLKGRDYEDKFGSRRYRCVVVVLEHGPKSTLPIARLIQ